MKKIAVFGSINVDLVVCVPRFLKPGETLSGSEFSSFEGGKGANQAVAIAKLGGNVTMYGKVGADLYGVNYIHYMKNLHIDTAAVQTVENVSTGVAVITVNAEGQNCIAIVAGANAHLNHNYVTKYIHEISKADYLLLQLETPVDSVFSLIQQTAQSSVQTILDPAPAQHIPDHVYQYIDFITPNETETEILTGITVENSADALKAANFFLRKGVKNVIIKAGKNGAYMFNQSESFFVPSYSVEVKDTTAAGDTFNGVFAYALCNGKNFIEAVQYACAASALKITGLGAQKAMPDNINDIENLMKSQSDKQPVPL